ncbi:hypothetical protein BHM03_00049367 [Ensete ventricosum]|nr:hypothetical protein BHM03_00049367 [Ensete ventricosum]
MEKDTPPTEPPTRDATAQHSIIIRRHPPRKGARRANNHRSSNFPLKNASTFVNPVLTSPLPT